MFGGATVMPGSTLGGLMAPCWWVGRPLGLPRGGTICSGGGDAELGGAIGTLGLSGEVGCGFCAIAEPAAAISPISRKVLCMKTAFKIL